jgi:hypothetical protein
MGVLEHYQPESFIHLENKLKKDISETENLIFVKITEVVESSLKIKNTAEILKPVLFAGVRDSLLSNLIETNHSQKTYSKDFKNAGDLSRIISLTVEISRLEDTNDFKLLITGDLEYSNQYVRIQGREIILQSISTRNYTKFKVLTPKQELSEIMVAKKEKVKGNGHGYASGSIRHSYGQYEG